MSLKRRKYQPRPDVAFLTHGFPRFLVEIDSTDNQRDRLRLHVQLACALHLALALRRVAGVNNEDFFLMGAFIDKFWVIHRYFYYVREGKVRSRVSNRVNLT